jgi:hypothetical protein
MEMQPLGGAGNRGGHQIGRLGSRAAVVKPWKTGGWWVKSPGAIRLTETPRRECQRHAADRLWSLERHADLRDCGSLLASTT